MIRHARPAADVRRAELIRHAADTALLAAMFAVILAVCLVFAPQRGDTRQTEQMTHAQNHAQPAEPSEPH